jgi:hypothetical protein
MEAARGLLEDIAQYFTGHTTPRQQLQTLRRDRDETEAEIRAVLERLARKYNVSGDDVDETMNTIGLAIGDLTYEPETEYLEELDTKATV